MINGQSRWEKILFRDKAVIKAQGQREDGPYRHLLVSQ